jgi:hypothetical protein
MKTKVVAPIALSVGLLGIVGGVAATQAFHPVAKPAQVRLVQPAAQTITVAPSPTTTAPAPVKTTAATPKVIKPAPVQSTQAVAPAPRVVQKAAVASTDTSGAPAPSPSSSSAAPAGANPPPPIPEAPCPIGSTKPGCGNHPGVVVPPSGTATTTG